MITGIIMYLISTVLIHIRNISEANIKYAIPQSYNDIRCGIT